jgi:DNA-directed RNA polymerase III subunit RPC8
LWVWEYETDEGTHDLFMDINEEIRFRVIDERFTDLSPTGPEKTSQDQAGNQDEKSPYNITVSNRKGIFTCLNFRKKVSLQFFSKLPENVAVHVK